MRLFLFLFFSFFAVEFDKRKGHQLLQSSVRASALFKVNGKVDSALVGTFVFLMSEALAASTLSSYGSHESAYLQFCDGPAAPH